MFSYRTIAGFGAAALAFLALTRVSRRFRHRAGEATGDFIEKAAGKMEGIIRRRTAASMDTTSDVI
ncbi:MAG: hypothetical protein K6T29_03235 [Peptococcaceae bacterium]|nr:hypothetical protein [Peptococcaceae bacterium]